MLHFSNNSSKLISASPAIEKALQGLSQSRFCKPDETIKRFLDAKELISEKELAQVLQGLINLGFVNNSEIIFGLRPEDAPKNVLIIGLPGTGKTNLSRVILEGFIRNTESTIIWFDKKGTEKSLYNYLTQILEKEKILFLSPERNLCENPFNSPHPRIEHEQWYRLVSNVLLPSLGVRFESGNALLAAAFKAKKNLPDNQDPCLFDIYPCLVSLRPKRYDERVKADYYARSEFRVEMCLINLPNVFSYRKGLPFQEYRKRRFILIDLSKTDDFSSKLIVESFVAKIVNFQLTESIETDLSWVLIFDEAENYYSYNKIETFAGLSPLEQYIRMTRSTGVWQILSNQSYTSLSLGARAMAGAKIIFKTDPTEMRQISESMSLKFNEETINMIDSLQVGEAIVKLDSRPGTPIFKINVPEFKVNKDIDEEKIFELINQRFDCKPIPEEEKQRVLNMIFQELEKEKPKAKTMPEIKQEAETSDKRKILQLLNEIATNSFLTFTEHIDNLNFHSVADADRIKKILLEKNFVNEYKIKLKKGRGSLGSYLELTEEGKNFLHENGFKPSNSYEGKSGFLHALIVHKLIKPFYEKSYEVLIEGKNKGYDCDLGIYRSDKAKCAVEVSVTTTPEDEIKNIKRDLNSGYENVQIIIVATSNKDNAIVEDEEKAMVKKQALREALIKEFDKTTQEKIQILTLKQFRDLT